MYKSVFTKYMVAFAVIIFISFFLLAFIISSIINKYATNTVKDEVSNTAEVAVNVLEYNYKHSGRDKTFEEYLGYYQDAVQNLLSGVGKRSNERLLLISDMEGKILFGMNAEGEILLGVDKDGKLIGNSYDPLPIPAQVMQELSENGRYESEDNMLGYFVNRFIVCAIAVHDSDGEGIGAVFSCSSSAGEDALIRTMNRTVIMVSLWVMLAAMIAVYFISDRITSPLRSMTNVAKDFAHGKMDSRVNVNGKDEIAELGTAFNNMAESLQENEKMRNAFLANVSHDLRTPMTTIAGFVDGMISGAIPQDKQPEYLEIVSSEVHRLSRLVSQILDVSRLESGERKFTFVRFDICEMARLILISFEQKIEEKKLEVVFECDRDSMYANGDSDAIHQVLYNLCDNAIKFSRESGLLRLNIAVKAPGKIQVTVYNEGQGIPAEDLPYVFERFYKSDKSRGLDKTGVGLGLYIVKTILEAQHQSIEVESVQNQYCEFRFTLKEDKSE